MCTLSPRYGTQVLDNTRPFLCSSIVSFWITAARSITFWGNTGTPKMFQYSPIEGFHVMSLQQNLPSHAAHSGHVGSHKIWPNPLLCNNLCVDW